MSVSPGLCIYYRNDHQCLHAYVCGKYYEVEKDPLLRETYHSIAINDRLVWFKNLISGRVSIYDPVGVALYEAQMAAVKYKYDRAAKEERCKVDLDELFFLENRLDELNGKEFAGEPLYLKGKTFFTILEWAKLDPEALECWRSDDVEFDPDRLYLIPAYCLEEDGKIDLNPTCVGGLIEQNDESFHEIEPLLIYDSMFRNRNLPLEVTGRQIFDFFIAAQEYKITQFSIDPDRKYKIPSEMIVGGEIRLKFTDVPEIINYNNLKISI